MGSRNHQNHRNYIFKICVSQITSQKRIYIYALFQIKERFFKDFNQRLKNVMFVENIIREFPNQMLFNLKKQKSLMIIYLTSEKKNLPKNERYFYFIDKSKIIYLKKDPKVNDWHQINKKFINECIFQTIPKKHPSSKVNIIEKWDRNNPYLIDYSLIGWLEFPNQRILITNILIKSDFMLQFTIKKSAFQDFNAKINNSEELYIRLFIPIRQSDNHYIKQKLFPIKIRSLNHHLKKHHIVMKANFKF